MLFRSINGFGRIGRLAFRQMFEAEGYEVVAINDLTNPKMLAHLLKYDTAQGGFAGKFGEGKHTVEATENSIIVDGKEIKISAEPNAANCPWAANDVDVVLECTGFYTSKEKASAHLQAGAKKVVISAPAGNDLPTIVYNVNHETLTADDKVISAASRSCRDNLIVSSKSFVVHVVNDGWEVVTCRSRDNYLLCTSLEVSRSFFLRSVETSTFENYVYVVSSPWAVCCVWFSRNLDFLAVNDD